MIERVQFDALQALQEMAEHLERSGNVAPLFRFGVGGERYDHAMPSGTESLMNSGPAKDQIFRFFRQYVRENACDLAVFGSDCWNFHELQPIADAILRRFTCSDLVEMGLMSREETLVVVAQDAADVLIVKRAYERKPEDGPFFRWLRDAEEEALAQADFAGRFKMFGDLSPANLHEDATFEGSR